MRRCSNPIGRTFEVRGATALSLMVQLALLLLGPVRARPAAAERFYYGLEVKGVLCGFKEVACETALDGQGRAVLRLASRVSAKGTILGASLDFAMKSSFELQPETGEMLTHANEITVGNSSITVDMARVGGLIRITAKPDNAVQTVPVGPEVHFDNTQYYPFLVRDFAAEGVRSKRYQFFDPKDALIHTVTFSRERAEDLDGAGQKHPALVLSQVDHKTRLLQFGSLRGQNCAKTPYFSRVRPGRNRNVVANSEASHHFPVAPHWRKPHLRRGNEAGLCISESSAPALMLTCKSWKASATKAKSVSAS